mmetsp:Transcript_2709/g.8504  ORF Transcript_2709/g.8504 Transcript_2709/m.8504 type:complete len:248 (-) Transcript_2709:772-1515(-)
MIECLLGGEALLRILFEKTSQEIEHDRWCTGPVTLLQAVFSATNLLHESVTTTRGLLEEGKLTSDHGIENHTDTPEITSRRVASDAAQSNTEHFWSQVVQGAYKRSGYSTADLDIFCDAEINQLEPRRLTLPPLVSGGPLDFFAFGHTRDHFVKKHVVEFDVAMDETLRVQVLNSLEQLMKQHQSQRHLEAVFCLHKIVQLSTTGQFQAEMEMRLGLDHLEKTADVIMPERCMHARFILDATQCFGI